ncbi:MAG: type II toxin-antitoxin system Phd/YefM family antitoxin [Fimbriimonadaceae bacterium]
MIRPSDIHSVSTFTRNAKQLIHQVTETKNPIAITVNGEAEVVIQDARAYEQTQEILRNYSFDQALARADKDMTEGRFVTLEQLESEVNEILGIQD